jgi:hypothetical protein
MKEMKGKKENGFHMVHRGKRLVEDAECMKTARSRCEKLEGCGRRLARDG